MSPEIFLIVGLIVLLAYCAVRLRASVRYASDLKAQLVRENVRHMNAVDELTAIRDSLIAERNLLRAQNDRFQQGRTPPLVAKAEPARTPTTPSRAVGKSPAHAAPPAARRDDDDTGTPQPWVYASAPSPAPEPEPCRASSYSSGGGGDFGGGGASGSWDSGSSSSSDSSSSSNSSSSD